MRSQAKTSGTIVPKGIDIDKGVHRNVQLTN